MKGLKFLLFILATTLLTACGFSQTLQPKPIQLDNEDGVFISIELMDSISLKLIDRQVLTKENQTLNEILQNVRTQKDELGAKFNLSLSQIDNYKNLWKVTELQKQKLFESLEHQKTITSNVKKNYLRTVFYTSAEVSRLVWSPLLC